MDKHFLLKDTDLKTSYSIDNLEKICNRLANKLIPTYSLDSNQVFVGPGRKIFKKGCFLNRVQSNAPGFEYTNYDLHISFHLEDDPNLSSKDAIHIKFNNKQVNFKISKNTDPSGEIKSSVLFDNLNDVNILLNEINNLFPNDNAKIIANRKNLKQELDNILKIINEVIESTKPSRKRNILSISSTKLYNLNTKGNAPLLLINNRDSYIIKLNEKKNIILKIDPTKYELEKQVKLKQILEQINKIDISKLFTSYNTLLSNILNYSISFKALYVNDTNEHVNNDIIDIKLLDEIIIDIENLSSSNLYNTDKTKINRLILILKQKNIKDGLNIQNFNDFKVQVINRIANMKKEYTNLETINDINAKISESLGFIFAKIINNPEIFDDDKYINIVLDILQSFYDISNGKKEDIEISDIEPLYQKITNIKEELNKKPKNMRQTYLKYSSNNYYSKYLKYKQKYLLLKNK